MPVTFAAQWAVRFFQARTPKFFKILMAVFGLLASANLGFEYYHDEIVELDLVPLEWLKYIGIFLKVTASLSGVIVAKSTIQTPETPVLITDDKPKSDDIQAMVNAAVQAELGQIRRNTPTNTGL